MIASEWAPWWSLRCGNSGTTKNILCCLAAYFAAAFAEVWVDPRAGGRMPPSPVKPTASYPAGVSCGSEAPRQLFLGEARGYLQRAATL